MLILGTRRERERARRETEDEEGKRQERILRNTQREQREQRERGTLEQRERGTTLIGIASESNVCKQTRGTTPNVEHRVTHSHRR